MSSSKRIIYDFREGIEANKIIYKDESICNCFDFWVYIGCMLLTWCWSVGWFALFLYAWTTDRHASFIAFLVIWSVFIAFMILFVFAPNYYNHYKKKEAKRLAKEKLKQEEEDRLNQQILDAQKESPTKNRRDDQPKEEPKNEQPKVDAVKQPIEEKPNEDAAKLKDEDKKENDKPVDVKEIELQHIEKDDK